MNHIMAFVLRIAYVSARLNLHAQSVALVGKPLPDGFVKEVKLAIVAFADLCEVADDLEKKKCHECGAAIPG